MDMTLDDDNSDSWDINDNESEPASRSELAGVTDMDGGTSELHKPASKVNTQPFTESDKTILDGVTNEQNCSKTADCENASPQQIQNNVVPPDQPPGEELDIPMDGVTETSYELTLPSGQNDQIGGDATPVTEQSSANTITIISHIDATLGGVTPNTAITGQHSKCTADSNAPVASETNDESDTPMDGVTSAKTVEQDVESTAASEMLENQTKRSDQNQPLDGVTADEVGRMSEMLSKLPKKTVSEIIFNNDFPEKTLLLGGETNKVDDIEPKDSMETLNSPETNLTLPDLVCNSTKNTDSNQNDQQRRKSPTERLLNAFGSPIPSELEDDANVEQSRDYHTTEDEDDTIDGLLALSNQPTKPETPEKESKPSKYSKKDRHKAKKNRQGKKKKTAQ